MTLKPFRAAPFFSALSPAITLSTYQKILHSVSLLILLGFVPSYVWQFSELTQSHHLHAALSLLWLILLNFQSLLIYRSNVTGHRILGWTASLLALMMSLSTIVLFQSTFQQRMGSSTIFSLVYVLDFYLFPVYLLCFTMAILHRKQPLTHASYIVLSTIMLLPPGLGRLIYGIFLLPVSASQRYFFEPMFLCTLVLLTYLGYREKWQCPQTRWVISGMLLTLVFAYLLAYGLY